MNQLGEPDAGKLPVRFDARKLETRLAGVGQHDQTGAGRAEKSSGLTSLRRSWFSAVRSTQRREPSQPGASPQEICNKSG